MTICQITCHLRENIFDLQYANICVVYVSITVLCMNIIVNSCDQCDVRSSECMPLTFCVLVRDNSCGQCENYCDHCENSCD